jgi:ArsR family transcriptional regulator
VAKTEVTIGQASDSIAACCTPGLRAPMARENADQLAKVLKAVADPVRLQLLSIIKSSGEACACDLNEPVGLTQPTVSHHLKVLTEAGLIHREQRGTWAWFSIHQDRLRDLSALFADS